MAVTQTPRLGLDQWSASTDPWPTRTGWNANQGKLDDQAAIDLQVDTTGERPPAGVRGRYCYVTGTGRLWRDTGAAWVEVGPVGGAGAGGPLAFGAAGVEGVSTRAARADHTHTMPAHDPAAHGAIPLSALAAPTADVSAGGQRITNLASPEASSDAVNRNYVWSQLGAHFASGLDSIGASSTTATVSFGQTFAGTPRVVVTERNAGETDGLVVLSVESVTQTGCVVRKRTGSGGTTPGFVAFVWFATDQ